MDPSNPGLTEDMAWPARPQDTYGLEKLYAEEMAIAYAKDFPIVSRVARYHNVYGPRGTWKGGREKVHKAVSTVIATSTVAIITAITTTTKYCSFFNYNKYCHHYSHIHIHTHHHHHQVPAAFCRKAVVSTEEFEMWGDGLQTRSFMFIDDCVEGSIRIMLSDCEEPLNLGTDEMVNMIEFAELAMRFEGKKLPIKHITGPMGVRGRNSDNTMIKDRLKWAPSISINDGLKITHAWIKGEIEAEEGGGAGYGTSDIVQQVTDTLDSLQK